MNGLCRSVPEVKAVRQNAMSIPLQTEVDSKQAKAIIESFQSRHRLLCTIASKRLAHASVELWPLLSPA